MIAGEQNIPQLLLLAISFPLSGGQGAHWQEVRRQEAAALEPPLCGQKIQKELMPLWHGTSARGPGVWVFPFTQITGTGNRYLSVLQHLKIRTLDMGQACQTAEQLQTHYESRFHLPLSLTWNTIFIFSFMPPAFLLLSCFLQSSSCPFPLFWKERIRGLITPCS